MFATAVGDTSASGSGLPGAVFVFTPDPGVTLGTLISVPAQQDRRRRPDAFSCRFEAGRMIPQLDLHRNIVNALPALSLEQLRASGRKHVSKRQEFLVRLLQIAYEGGRPHVDDPRCSSFSREFLTKGLRVGKGGYRSLLEPYFESPLGQTGYSPRRGVTKAYHLDHTVRRELAAVYRTARPRVIWKAAIGEYEADDVPQNGIPKALRERLSVPAVVPMKTVDVARVRSRLTEWSRLVGPEAHIHPTRFAGMTVQEALEKVDVVSLYVSALGGLPNTYSLKTSGRLGYQGSIHVIPLPNTLRQLLFEGHGLHDYDLRCCFWSILQSVGEGIGFGTAHISSYVEQRDRWHRHWTQLTGHCDEADLKSVALSWLTGGTLSDHPRTTNVRTIGRWAMQQLARDPATVALVEEVKHGIRALIEHFVSPLEEGVRNAVGATIPVPEGTGRSRKIASHLLTGFEQFAIREACSRVKGLKAIIYDGFIAPRVPVGPLEDAIRQESQKELGITLDLKLKRVDLGEPLEDPEEGF